MNVFKRLLGRSEPSSGDVAKRRLRFVLVQDRLNLPPETMTKLKTELIGVISKYVEIDLDGIDISITGNGRQNHLTADIPVIRTRHS
ncbi:cell division topological specificity factor MinE [Anaerolineales bacterium HSG6]|nr:cell division topological specificity factor MinE [Anaerolineales bacterium HSG6]MDM8529873.1 cell division topological specificity factor MinE [Anaerolineales bacterium HSG25]